MRRTYNQLGYCEACRAHCSCSIAMQLVLDGHGKESENADFSRSCTMLTAHYSYRYRHGLAMLGEGQPASTTPADMLDSLVQIAKGCRSIN